MGCPEWLQMTATHRSLGCLVSNSQVITLLNYGGIKFAAKVEPYKDDDCVIKMINGN